MPYYLSPVGNDQQSDANGNPFVGGKIFTYLAGTSTPAATYTDATSGTSQANPIILNSLGLANSPIWLLGGQPMKFVFQDATGVLIRTVDNVSGINDITSTNTSSEWISSGFAPTYLSATSFSVVGDKTSLLHVGRRVQTTNSGGTIYSTIASSVFATGITTVTVTNDSGSLDAGLSVLLYAMLDSLNPSVPGIYAKDALVVHLAGSETLTGAKTFSAAPIFSVPPTYSAGSGATILGTAVATTSGTAFDFTGIPSWAKRVTVSFSGVGTSGSSALMLQIGAGSVDTTSTYSGSGGYLGANTAQFSNDTIGFLLMEPASSGASTIRRHGQVVFTSMGSNLWAMSGVFARSDSLYGGIGGGSKTLSGALDRVRITTFNGTDTFAAGSANIIWE